MKLIELAKVLRSKNAGPLQVTVDLMFADSNAFEIALQSEALTAPRVAEAYGVSPSTVVVIPFRAALAIKVVIDRPVIAGSPGDTDVYGAQQHKPLLEIEL
ncbi:DUF4387 domain-containing protein [Microvirga antarctica]|uniref:DUF4387 domain-containing protein n=1 Tax=Microvirga antarctica TaxID=2819233 RepID=UPI001B318143|nr:DUF4387 domain-containing protein [Microvirga antarctica]